jgi:hypothetical protein
MLSIFALRLVAVQLVLESEFFQDVCFEYGQACLYKLY